MATTTKRRLTAEQAFPFLKPHEDVGTYIPGMTLRDYFAAQALQGILVNVEPMVLIDTKFTSVTGVAYLIADAMLEARK